MTPATLETHQAPAHRDALSDQIGDWLRRMRVELELDLTAAAALCGDAFSARSLRGWEQGRRAINVADLDTLLRAYGVSTAWFMSEAVLISNGSRVTQP